MYTYLFAVVFDVSYLAPGESDLWRQLVVMLINVQTECVHSYPQLRAFLVL